MTDNTKTCIRCGEEKDLSFFRKREKWYSNTCKKCDQVVNIIWRKNNRNKVLQNHRRYYEKHRRPSVLTYGRRELESFPKKECKCGCGGLVSPKETFMKKTRHRCVYYPKYIEGHKKVPVCIECGGPNLGKSFKYCSVECRVKARARKFSLSDAYIKWKDKVQNSDSYFKKQFINRTGIDGTEINSELVEAYKQYVLLKREVRNVKNRSVKKHQ